MSEMKIPDFIGTLTLRMLQVLTHYFDVMALLNINKVMWTIKLCSIDLNHKMVL